MSIGDIILALIVVAVVFFAVRSVFVKKSVGCSGDCAHCGASFELTEEQEEFLQWLVDHQIQHVRIG